MFISAYGPGSEKEVEGFWNVLKVVSGILVVMNRW